MLLAGPAPDGARAAAWNQEAGRGLVIADVTFSGGSKYFNGSGKLSPAAAYAKRDAAAYVEYGVTDWLTMIAEPSLAFVTAASSPEAGAARARYAGLGTSAAGAQLHLLTYGPAVFSVQGSLRLPGTSSRRNPAVIGNTAREADLKGLLGGSFVLGGLAAFVNLEGGYRFRSDGASGEWHGDVTLGARLLPRLTVLVQSFNVLSTGAGTSWLPAASSMKLGGAMVYDLSERWSLEAGAFQTVLGAGALRERGLEAAVWYRF